MSVKIEGMDMPGKCAECRFFRPGAIDACCATGYPKMSVIMDDPEKTTAHFCPLVPLYSAPEAIRKAVEQIHEYTQERINAMPQEKKNEQ